MAVKLFEYYIIKKDTGRGVWFNAIDRDHALSMAIALFDCKRKELKIKICSK